MDDFLKVDQKQLWEELVKLNINIGQKKKVVELKYREIRA